MGKLTQQRLREVLCYDPETGVFVWIDSNRKAGCICKTNGYRLITIDGKKQRASRMAWLFMEGYLPEYEIDHRNRIKSDDRWTNLRHSTSLCNSINRGLFKNNKSGISGVSWCERDKKWRADIRVVGRLIFLGRYKTKLDAARVRYSAEIDHDFPDCNSVSSAYLYLKERGGAG